MKDIAIIGSGFGGAVMAARLGAAARALSPAASVVVLEQGNDPTGAFDPRSEGDPLNAQGNRFRHTLAPKYLAQHAQLFTDPTGAYRPGVSSLNVLTGRGLGGGSNVYDAVSLRAPTLAFDQKRDGARLWPAAYSRAALEPYYARVEQKLNVVRLAWTDAQAPHWQLCTKRDLVFAEGCRRVGATALPLRVADRDDANEGWWNEGPRFEGRQSLTKNYLLDAKSAGVEFWTSCEVEKVSPTKDGYALAGVDHRTNTPLSLECRLLVVAAGAIGSTQLLLRSQPEFTAARALDPGGVLGKHLSANGDYGVSGIIGEKYELDVEGYKGKPMSSFCPSYFAQHQFILIPFYAAPLYLSLGTFSTLVRPTQQDARGRHSTEAAERDWGLSYKKRLSRFGARMMTMGCLALDACEGEVRLGPEDRGAVVAWRQTGEETERRWSAANEAMQRIYEALGGEMFLDGYRKDGTVNTSHPLGGCRMTERTTPESGVVDPLGESLRNKNLFVVDSAAIPSSLGVNPSLTIAAVAESIADRLVKGEGTPGLAARLGR